MTAPPVNLSYRAERPRRWKVNLRRSVLMVVTAVIAVLAIRYANRYLESWKTFNAQEIAKRFAPANDIVVATAGESKLENVEYWRAGGKLGLGQVYSEWTAFGKNLIRQDTRIVYVGFHKSPNGNARIIAVALNHSFGMRAGGVWFGIDVWVYSEGTRTRSPKREHVTPDFIVGCAGEEIEVMNGRPDSNDPAKFEIHFKGERFLTVVEGELNDDNSVKLLIRQASTRMK